MPQCSLCGDVTPGVGWVTCSGGFRAAGTVPVRHLTVGVTRNLSFRGFPLSGCELTFQVIDTKWICGHLGCTHVAACLDCPPPPFGGKLKTGTRFQGEKGVSAYVCKKQN